MYEIRRAMFIGEEEVEGRKLYKYIVYRFLVRTKGYRASTINKLCKEYLNKTLPHIVDQYHENEFDYLVLDKKICDIQNESIEITHTAYSRNVYAEGAIRAARFIVGKRNGLYKMEDLL